MLKMVTTRAIETILASDCRMNTNLSPLVSAAYGAVANIFRYHWDEGGGLLEESSSSRRAAALGLVEEEASRSAGLANLQFVLKILHRIIEPHHEISQPWMSHQIRAVEFLAALSRVPDYLNEIAKGESAIICLEGLKRRRFLENQEQDQDQDQDQEEGVQAEGVGGENASVGASKEEKVPPLSMKEQVGYAMLTLLQRLQRGEFLEPLLEILESQGVELLIPDEDEAAPPAHYVEEALARFEGAYIPSWVAPEAPCDDISIDEEGSTSSSDDEDWEGTEGTRPKAYVPINYPAVKHIIDVAPLEPLGTTFRGPMDMETMKRQRAERMASGFVPRTVYSHVAHNKLMTKMKPICGDKPKSEGELVFDARFESGNLEKAVAMGESEYNLTLREDSNSRGHTQWYYFAIGHMQKGKNYRFNIVNLEKPGSLYNDGMLPLLYSKRRADDENVGWRRVGTDVGYYKGSEKRSNGKYYYTATFTVSFPHDKDICFLSYAYPYTVADLNSDTKALLDDPARSIFVRYRELGLSLGDVPLHLLTIADPEGPVPPKHRQKIVISARVHPGESNGSWMMRGFIDFITDPDRVEAAELRRDYLIQLVPMVNPDGVAVGNYRCSMAGLDLNRQWRKPSKKITPTVYQLKKLLKERPPVIYVDLHGHSRKAEAFMYGCPVAKQGSLQHQVIPYFLSQLHTGFSHRQCSFNTSKSKRGTGRVVGFVELKVQLCYTLEVNYLIGAVEGLGLNPDLIL